MMTINGLTFALLKGNIRKYRLFVICNILVTGMLLSLHLLLENPYLNDPKIVDPMISSNIFAPTLFIYVFVGFFIPYASILLNRQIQKNYGILLAMGMAKDQYVKCILAENLLLMLLSISGGVVTGTLLEYFLIICVRMILKYPDRMFYLSKTGYVQTMLFTMILFLIVLLTILLKNVRMNILDTITDERKTEQKREHKMRFVFGCILFWISLIISYLFYEATKGNILLPGIVFSFIGLWVMWFSVDWIIKKWRQKKLFLIADYLYYSKTNAKLGIMLTGLFGAFIFINTIASVSDSSLKHDVGSYYPYDLVYTQEEGMDREELLTDYGVCVEEQKELIYIYTDGYAVMGADDVNILTQSTFQVPEGKYLFIRSVVLNDGYPHERGYVPEELEIGGQDFALYEDIDQLLFCRGGGLTDNLILLNQEEFDTIRNAAKDRQVLHLCKFRKDEDQNGLAEYIERKTGSDVASGYEAYMRAEKSAGLLHFLIGYVSVILLISAVLSIYYRQESEEMKDETTYRILLLCGAEESFLVRCRREKLFYSVLVPYMISVIWMTIVSYINTFTYQYQIIAMGKCCMTGLLLGDILLSLFAICKKRSRM